MALAARETVGWLVAPSQTTFQRPGQHMAAPLPALCPILLWESTGLHQPPSIPSTASNSVCFPRLATIQNNSLSSQRAALSTLQHVPRAPVLAWLEVSETLCTMCGDTAFKAFPLLAMLSWTHMEEGNQTLEHHYPRPEAFAGPDTTRWQAQGQSSSAWVSRNPPAGQNPSLPPLILPSP